MKTYYHNGYYNSQFNEKNKDAQWAKDIVAAYHSQEFKDYMDKNNNGLWFVPKGE